MISLGLEAQRVPVPIWCLPRPQSHDVAGPFRPGSICIYVYIHIYVNVYTYICVYIYICIDIDLDTDLDIGLIIDLDIGWRHR